MLLLTPLIALIVSVSSVVAAPAVTDLDYDYIVVGSGAGGGPLASRLARAGHRTLLIEAGDDQGTNYNYSVPGYQAAVTQDPRMRWDIFVNHYQDQSRAQRDCKYVYDVNGKDFVGCAQDAPQGATPKGILYPRAATLGGCASHNALIWITPHASDWDGIASLTGDQSWQASNMQQYLRKVENRQYAPNVGFNDTSGWLTTSAASLDIVLRDNKLIKHLAAGANVMGLGSLFIKTLTGLAGTVLIDPNSYLPNRDSQEGFFQIPLSMKMGARNGPRDFIVDTINAGFPLTLRTSCHVTKVTFDKTGAKPRATGVEFLDGANLYRASPLHASTKGVAGKATASKEVILSGGAFNTPQMLKLSGIGAAAELKQFGIPVLVDLPGVGTNMMDRYEVPVNSLHADDFSLLDGCTFDAKPHDKCYATWRDNPSILSARGAYATNGLAAAMVKHSDYASDSNVDLFIFGGPVDFNGYFPGWGDYAVRSHRYWSWYTLKAHTRNRAGTVQLNSADPLDPPKINFNYFDTGTTEGGADDLDASALVQAIKLSREALSHYGDFPLPLTSNFTEVSPGPAVQSDDDLKQYVKDNAWGHHASCTCPIGPDSDPMAVLDSKFRVRGVNGLRVVDASVFPSIPGVFIAAPVYMVSEKAADVIINGD